MILAVALGAFGAHAIRSTVTPLQMGTWQTASEYHFFHALGLVALGIWMRVSSVSKSLQWSGGFLIAGIVLFCGSLYLLVLTGNTRLGIITPFGGVCFMLGWFAWLLSVLSEKHAAKKPTREEK